MEDFDLYFNKEAQKKKTIMTYKEKHRQKLQEEYKAHTDRTAKM